MDDLRPGKILGYGIICTGRDSVVGGDHGNRGRRGCAECVTDGDRACGTHGSRTIASAPWPGWTRHRRRHMHIAVPEAIIGDRTARLKIIFEQTDGFEIARHDLRLRGPGEFLGARQSGLPLLRFADLEKDEALLQAAALPRSAFARLP